MMKISKNSTENQNGPGIILSTVHGAKGQEYDRVYIDPDLAAALSKPGGPPVKEFGDEANIAYVAFTRAIRELYLPQDFKTILTPEWQAAIKRYEPVQSPRTSHAPQPRHAKAAFSGFSISRSGPLTAEATQSPPPHKKTFKVGDRVRTSHGIGTIVEVDGDKYLVDLDGQAAQLWEKAWGLRKA
jgi:hypothetical protein